MIELKNITKKYKNAVAVDNVSLKIEPKESVVFAGMSGSGKTTLLRLIAGFEAPDSGEIQIRGQCASKPHKIIVPPNRRGIGMIFQDLALWPHLSVLENLEFGLKARGLKKTERKQKIEIISDLIKLNGHLSRYPQSLSGGEKQRVALARTLVLEPDIMLMDEPLSNLDTVLKDEFQNLITSLVKRLKLVLLYVTHDRDEALAVADRIAVMSEGSLVQTGTANDLLENPKTDFVKKFMRKT
jgi:ABC-type Fe3+/spermidine/putrescine transport system ATPase subunit